MRRAALFDRALAALRAEGITPTTYLRAPGRIEFPGKHTDYAAGPWR